MTQPLNKTPRRRARGCSWLCRGDETCPGPKGVPHHHHGRLCLLYDVWPYSSPNQKREVAQQLGRLLSGALVPKSTRVRCDNGQFASWAPMVPQDEAMAPYVTALTPVRTALTPVRAKTWTGTSAARGCAVKDDWCDQACLAEMHHHHGVDCLMYDAWPYSLERQLAEVERIFGTDPVGWSRFVGLRKPYGTPIEAGTDIHTSSVKVRWVPEFRLDYLPAAEAEPSKKKVKVVPPQPPKKKKSRVEKDRERQPLVPVRSYVVPEEWGPRKSAPREIIGTPPVVRSEEAYRYGCGKLVFMNEDAAWAAIRRTLEADEEISAPDDNAENLAPYLCRAAPHGWHIGHRSPLRRQLQSR